MPEVGGGDNKPKPRTKCIDTNEPTSQGNSRLKIGGPPYLLGGILRRPYHAILLTHANSPNQLAYQITLENMVVLAMLVGLRLVLEIQSHVFEELA